MARRRISSFYRGHVGHLIPFCPLLGLYGQPVGMIAKVRLRLENQAFRGGHGHQLVKEVCTDCVWDRKT